MSQPNHVYPPANFTTPLALVCALGATAAAAQTTPLTTTTVVPPATITTDGGSTSINVVVPTNATSDATFVINVNGDLDGQATNLEQITVSIDGVPVGVFGATGNFDDQCGDLTFTLTIPQATLAPLIADENVTISYAATAAVSTALCPSPLAPSGTLSYVAPPCGGRGFGHFHGKPWARTDPEPTRYRAICRWSRGQRI